MKTDKITGFLTSGEQITNKEISFRNDTSIKVDEIVTFIFKRLNEGKFNMSDEKPVLVFLNNQDILSHEIYFWLSDNQNNSNSIFLFEYFNFFGIVTSKNHKKAFGLFINASKQNHILAQYYVGICFRHGCGVIKNEKLAFEYYKKTAIKDFAGGQL